MALGREGAPAEAVADAVVEDPDEVEERFEEGPGPALHAAAMVDNAAKEAHTARARLVRPGRTPVGWDVRR